MDIILQSWQMAYLIAQVCRARFKDKNDYKQIQLEAILSFAILKLLLLLRDPMMLVVLIKLFFIIKTRPCEITSDCVDNEEKKGNNQQSQNDIYRKLAQQISQKLPSAIILQIIIIIKFEQNKKMKEQHTNSFSKEKDDPKKQGTTLKMKLGKKLTKAQFHLKNIFMSRILFEEDVLDDTIFKSDLVIKMEVPTQQYINRNAKIELGSLIRNYPHSMFRAYEASYQQLFIDMQKRRDDISKQETTEKQLQIRNFSSFIPVQQYDIKKIKQRDEQQGSRVKNKLTKQVKLNSKEFHEEEQVKLNCLDQATGIIDAFIIYYNSLIYTLQQFCGFSVTAFMVTQVPERASSSNKANKINDVDIIGIKNEQVNRTIYILLYLPDDALIKAANKYHIKKQVDYTQVDPFLNDPTDNANRPLRFHSEIRKQIQKNVKQEQKKNPSIDDELLTSSQVSLISESLQLIEKRKKTDRKIGFMLPEHINKKGPKIMNEAKLSFKRKNSYLKFCKQLNFQLDKVVSFQKNKDMFEDPSNQDKLTVFEKDYLRFVNRGKLNPGVEKMLMQIKKKRRYWSILERVSRKNGFTTFEKPKLYAQFKLANKKMKFFGRLEKILLYKEMKVSPYGDIALFSKMDRIKLSYLVLKSSIRVQNFFTFNTKIFALTDQYEKRGKIGRSGSTKFYHHYEDHSKQKAPNMNGGLNGRNLQLDWNRFFVWKTSIDTLRNYLGEIKSFEIFIKTYMIQLFLILTPIGFLFQVLKMVYIDQKAGRRQFLEQVYFMFIYMFVVSIIYGFFIEKYKKAEQSFIKNFVEEAAYVQFIDKYKGPYKRDIFTDNANIYNEKDLQFTKMIKQILTIAGSYFIFIIIFGLQIGFYYGVRLCIVQVANAIPTLSENILSFIRPIHLVGYSVFFIVNLFLDKIVIIRLANRLTKIENRATKQTYLKSVNLKRLMFSIFTQLIGPIDIVYIQSASKTSCYSNRCSSELRSYAYCRFIISVAFALISIFIQVGGIIKNKIKIKTTLQLEKKGPLMSYSKKLSSFLEYVYKQSLKQPCRDLDIIDETTSLIHFALFICVFPLGPLISLLSMMITYNVEREDILINQQRPIPKIEKFVSYQKYIVVVGHLMLFYNFSYLFITQQWFQYNFPEILIALSKPLSINGVMAVKYLTIIVFYGIYEVIFLIGKAMGRKFTSSINERKYNMYQKYEVKVFNQGNTINLQQPKPLHSISRTYNLKLDIEENCFDSENNESENYIQGNENKKK